jgi:hypothetical protein
MTAQAITGARYPALRAAEALGLILPLYLALFASTYFMMERASAATFAQPLTRTDALYFTVTVFPMAGFGDITPESEAARVVLIVQMLGSAPRRQRRKQERRWPDRYLTASPANSLAASSVTVPGVRQGSLYGQPLRSLVVRRGPASRRFRSALRRRSREAGRARGPRRGAWL